MTQPTATPKQRGESEKEKKESNEKESHQPQPQRFHESTTPNMPAAQSSLYKPAPPNPSFQIIIHPRQE
jgi:hypothetical protein